MTEQEALAALQGDDPASAARAEAGVAGDYHGAIADCRQTLARTPHHFGALSGQGLCHMALGQYREAADLFRRTLAVHPHLQAARHNLARALAEAARGNGHRLGGPRPAGPSSAS